MIISCLTGKKKPVAAFVAAAFFFTLYSCLPAAPKKDISCKKTSPVFIHEGAVYRASSSPQNLFQSTASIRPRSFSSLEDGFIYWDSVSKKVTRVSANGRVIYTVPLDVAFVWIHEKWVFAREEVFTEEDGFQYRLYELYGKKLIERWGGFLDCFPSDVSFGNEGSVYLCGGNDANTENTVYKIVPRKDSTVVLRIPRFGDFLRLISLDDRLLVFASAREKVAGRLTVHILSDLEDAIPSIREVSLLGLPPEVLAFFGYGFIFNGDPVLPVALQNNDIALARFTDSSEGFSLTAFTLDSGGCFLPLSADDSCFWYLAHDTLSDPFLFSLACYDGEAIVFYGINP